MERDIELRQIADELRSLGRIYANIAHGRVFTIENQRDRARIIDRVHELLDGVTPEEQVEYGIYW